MAESSNETLDPESTQQAIAGMGRREVISALMKDAGLGWSKLAMFRSYKTDTLKSLLYHTRVDGFNISEHERLDEDTKRVTFPSEEELHQIWSGAEEEDVVEADYEEVPEEDAVYVEEVVEEEPESAEEVVGEEIIVATPARDFDPNPRVSTGEVSDQLAMIEKRILAAVTTPRAVHASLTEDDMALIAREVGKARKDIKALSAKIDESTKVLHGELVSIHEVVTKNMEAQAATQQLLISMRDALAQQAVTIQLLKEGKLDKRDFEDAMEAAFAEPASEPPAERPKIQMLTKEQTVITGGSKREALRYLRSVDRSELDDLAEFFGIKDTAELEDNVVVFKIIAKVQD